MNTGVCILDPGLPLEGTAVNKAKTKAKAKAKQGNYFKFNGFVELPSPKNIFDSKAKVVFPEYYDYSCPYYLFK